MPKSAKFPFQARPFRISLRVKLAFPILVFLIVILVILVWTTFQTVRGLVLERTEVRLKAVAEVFAETVKVPLILNNQQVLLANIEWMAKRPDVLEVRVEDAKGVLVGGERPTELALPEEIMDGVFIGVHRLEQDTYAVAVPIQAHARKLGRVLILFGKQELESELKEIFEEKLLLVPFLALGLAFVVWVMTWMVVRPLLALKKTSREILAGNLAARVNIKTLDEIQDLGDAFNEMVSRLGKSLDKLRMRTEALEESEEKYRVFVETASDIIFTLTPEGRLVLLNKGISGASREEVSTRGLPFIVELHTEESRKRFWDAFHEVTEKRKHVTNVLLKHLHRVNHAEIYYLMNISPVLDHDGNLKWVHVVMHDVTELRRVEMMKESLIRDVAHELKTPTAKFEMAVTWFEKEIIRNQEHEKYEKVVDILKKNTDRLMRTIMSIMDLSKLESGMAQLSAEPLDLNEVLDQVCQDMDPICGQKNLKLEKKLARFPLMIKGDRDMLYRLFVNLIGNSTKFTEEGKISVQSTLANDKAVVSVRDTGPGIEKDFLEKIFERFVQRTAASQGIGVGLTISRDIALLHHGRIWAESEGLGKGAVFQVEFPLMNATRKQVL